MKQGLLERMRDTSRARVGQALARESFEALHRRALAVAPPPGLRLQEGGFDVIAEVKLRSPSAGVLTDGGLDPARQAERYAQAGAAAVSVLTEPQEFGGSLEDLQRVAAALAPLGVPAMRKDFLVHPYQVWEARAAGAGGVLVILTMLDDDEVQALLAAAADAGLFVLLEAFDEQDLIRAPRLLPGVNAVKPNCGAEDCACATVAASESAPVLLGLNCRNLQTLAIDPQRFVQLFSAFPAGVPAVAESGLGSTADVAWVADLGYSLALIGSALMTSGDPGQLLTDMLAAGRERRLQATAVADRIHADAPSIDDARDPLASGERPARASAESRDER